MSEHDTDQFATLRAIASAMDALTHLVTAQTHEIKAVSSKIEDVQVKVIRLEEAKHGRDIERIMKGMEELKTRQANLELTNAMMTGQVAGTKFTLHWVYKLAPWVVSVAIAVYFFWESQGQ